MGMGRRNVPSCTGAYSHVLSRDRRREHLFEAARGCLPAHTTSGSAARPVTCRVPSLTAVPWGSQYLLSSELSPASQMSGRLRPPGEPCVLSTACTSLEDEVV